MAYLPLRYAASPEEFAETHDLFRRGDIIGVTGAPYRTIAGALSVSPTSMTLLTPCLKQIPTEHYGLKDQEVRYRKRYLDLMINDNVREIFTTRAKVVNYVRKYLDSLGFLEVRCGSVTVVSLRETVEKCQLVGIFVSNIDTSQSLFFPPRLVLCAL